jgi:hypothetical protein
MKGETDSGIKSAREVFFMHRWFVSFAFLAVVPFLGGCSSGYGCAAFIDRAIEVTVIDAETKAPAVEGAVGTIRDGDYTETLRVSGWTYARGGPEQGTPLWLGGALGRPGTYTVRVEKDGYEPWEVRGVRVRQDACQLNGGRLEAELKRKE